MYWQQLINDTRFGLEDLGERNTQSGVRSDFRRDYDRLIFSSPFRRLQNKTQVFPLPGSIFVHNRLTHSLEVSCVGKSMADEVTVALRERYHDREWAHVLDNLGDIVAAACLAHDLGNPPFGHSGEKAISTFFSEGEGAGLRPLLTDRQWTDCIHFEGNANAFRVLTHRFEGRRPGGFAMTYSTLAAIVKYPYDSSLAGDKGKFGFFDSERADFEHVADTLGMIRRETAEGSVAFARHPLVYLVEAADDICYEVMDIEDAHKLKILTTDTVIDVLLSYFEGDRLEHIRHVMGMVDDPNEKISYLRSCVIGTLTHACARTFIDNEQAILDGTFQGSLMAHIPTQEHMGFERCNALSWSKIYNAAQVVDIELAGNRIITFLLQKLIDAVMNPHLNYSRLLLSQVPGQYAVHHADTYTKIQAVLDHVSAMTDVYALDLYRRLNGMSLPAV